MALEKYTMIAGLALFVFFVAEIITLFNYMTTPPADQFVAVEPEPKIFQFISLSIAPALIMTGMSFLLAKFGYVVVLMSRQLKPLLPYE